MRFQNTLHFFGSVWCTDKLKLNQGNLKIELQWCVLLLFLLLFSILFTLTHNKEQIVDCSSFHVEEEDVLNQVSVSVIWNFRTVLAMKWGSSFKDYLSLFKWGKPINNTAKKSNIWPRFLTFTTDLDSEGKKAIQMAIYGNFLSV